MILDPDDVYFVTQHPDPRLKNQAVLSPADLETLPPNSVQPFEIVRWEPRCRTLTCNDLKNVVGLMAALVLSDRPTDSKYVKEVANFIWHHLPDELRTQILEYVKTADGRPPEPLADNLLRMLNRILQQYCLHAVVPSSFVEGDPVRSKLSAYLATGATTVEENTRILTTVFSDFFSRMDDSLIELHPGQNEMRFYTWDQSECHLPVGATSAVLCDDPSCNGATVQEFIVPALSPTELYEADSATVASSQMKTKLSPYVLAYLDDIDLNTNGRQGWNLRHLSVGDILIFEEKIGPKTHNPADANPQHRQAVRLTRVSFSVDPVSRVRLVEIEWDQSDALRFPLCISSIGPVEDGCPLRNDVSVARGNVLLVDHGRTLDPEWIGEPMPIMRREQCGDSWLDEVALPTPSRSELFRPVLHDVDLTFAQPVTACATATALLVQEPHKAIPALTVHGFPVATEPDDSFRDDDVPPPTLMTLSDLDDPLRIVQRLQAFDSEEMQRLESMLPPHAARFLQDVRTDQTLRRLVANMILSKQPGPGSRSCGTAEIVAGGDGSIDRKHRREAQQFAAALQAAVTWTVKQHLLDSDSEDQDVVVEVTNDRHTHLRFGDDDLGRRPVAGTSFYVTYRVGNGTAGNVGADRIRHLVFRTTQPAGIKSVRNPLPATGGQEPESLDHARVHAPSQYKKLRRAIIADDYAAIAMREFADEIQQARAMLNWMGTWYEVSVAVDPRSSVTNPAALVKRIESTLNQYRRIGHLLKVDLPRYVGLEIEMVVCVRSNHLSAHVRQELLDRFSSSTLGDGSRGFFHPDNFGFGDSLSISQIIAEAKNVAGVENIDITVFEKKGQGDQGERENGVMLFGALEIPRLDNDPLRPEAAVFRLKMEGSR
ncbi:MAG: putative baseplate assembly protein [Planctomycetaceae bacterium]